jgi:hypothetical protein
MFFKSLNLNVTNATHSNRVFQTNDDQNDIDYWNSKEGFSTIKEHMFKI